MIHYQSQNHWLPSLIGLYWPKVTQNRLHVCPAPLAYRFPAPYWLFCASFPYFLILKEGWDKFMCERFFEQFKRLLNGPLPRVQENILKNLLVWLYDYLILSGWVLSGDMRHMYWVRMSSKLIKKSNQNTFTVLNIEAKYCWDLHFCGSRSGGTKPVICNSPILE